MTEDEDRQFRSAYFLVKRRNPDAPPEVLEQLIVEHLAERRKRLEERNEMAAMRKRVNARTRDRQGVFDGTDHKPVLSQAMKEWLRDMVDEIEQEKPEPKTTSWGSAERQRKIEEYPGAWVTVEAMGKKLNAAMKARKFDSIVEWHRNNGTLDSLKDTYRGDFYQPIPGSPESKIYWGDFTNKQLPDDAGQALDVLQMLQPDVVSDLKNYARNAKVHGTRPDWYKWVHVKHFAMEITKPGIRIDTDIGSFDLDQFNYVTSVSNDWDDFIALLREQEGYAVWLCFEEYGKTLIDVHIDNNYDRVQDQWEVAKHSLLKTKDSYSSVIADRREQCKEYEATLASMAEVRRDLYQQIDGIEEEIRHAQMRVESMKVQIKSDQDAQLEAVSKASKDHQDALAKIGSMIKAVQLKQFNDSPAGVKRTPKERPLKEPAPKVMPEKQNNPFREKSGEDDQEKELLKAQLRATEAEKRELINKDRMMTMVAGYKEWASKTEQEKDLMFQAMLNEDIKELTAEEKKQFYSDAEKLRAKLANQKEPFLVTLPSPHQPEMLALRGGIEHKGSKLLIQLEEWGKGNTALVTLPDYNVRLLACLATDRKNKTAIAAITFKHPDGQKWMSIEQEVTGVMAKFQPGTPIHRYLSWNKDINDRLFIAKNQMSA